MIRHPRQTFPSMWKCEIFILFWQDYSQLDVNIITSTIYIMNVKNIHLLVISKYQKIRFYFNFTPRFSVSSANNVNFGLKNKILLGGEIIKWKLGRRGGCVLWCNVYHDIYRRGAPPSLSLMKPLSPDFLYWQYWPNIYYIGDTTDVVTCHFRKENSVLFKFKISKNLYFFKSLCNMRYERGPMHLKTSHNKWPMLELFECFLVW